VTERVDGVVRELAVLEEQRRALADDVEELRVRALVAESPLPARELAEAERHSASLARGKAALEQELARLRQVQAELLGQVVFGDG
jgi:hypothetical protein